MLEKLQEIESQYEKECVKLFDVESSEKCRVNLIHFTSSATIDAKPDLNKLVNLKNMLNVLTRLNNTINLFSGDTTTTHPKFAKLFAELNVHARMNGINDMRNSYFDKYTHSPHTTSTSTTHRKLNTVQLCTNIYEVEPNFYDDINSNYLEEKNLRPFGQDNHATMIFESNGIKIGFMALADELVYKELKEKIVNDLIVDDQSRVEYMDYLSEANKSSQALRTCGANIIVALAIMDDEKSVERLLNESTDLDLVICVRSSSVGPQLTCEACDESKRQAKRWLLRSSVVDHESQFPVSHLSMISLVVDSESNLNQITDIAITKYGI